MKVLCQEQSVCVTISIGVAHCPAGEEQTLESLLTQADEALYLSKSGGAQPNQPVSWKGVIL